MVNQVRRLPVKIAGLAVVSLCSGLHAASLVNVSILGSTDGGTTFSNNITVNPGQTINFEVLGQLAPVGTINTHTTSTITTITPGTDGLSSLAFNVVDSDGGTFNAASLALGAGWTAGSGASVGAVNGNTLTDVRPIQLGAFVGATSPSVILTGTFTVGALSNQTSEVLSGAWATTGTTSGGFKINNGSTKVITTTTESSTDPYVGFSSLTLSPQSVPEPATLALFGISGSALLARRRRTEGR